MASTLYIVATPIGHLDDLSLRAIHVLRQVDYIFAEDTRHSKRLLQYHGVDTPMQAYHEFSQDAQIEAIFQHLYQGKSVALISDAGTPLISDPGFRLVRRAQQEQIAVVPVPGACAAISALCASGIASDRFCFEGFLPAKSKARQDSLKALAKEPRTLIFYEAPHRIVDCLNDMLTVFGGQRPITLARELTKSFETIKQAPLADMLAFVTSDANQQRGEIVLVVEGFKAPLQEDLSEQAKQLIALLKDEVSPNTLSKALANAYALPKKAVYDYILSLKAD